MSTPQAPLQEIRLRHHQKQILRYRRGKMGIAAVPGSGKTFTLSLLAAQLIRLAPLADDQEVLVVTLVNSAVDIFYQRVSQFISSYGLLPSLGYQVRTLHSLAHDIVRERPSLVGLPENFSIIDERAADSIRNEIAVSWYRAHPDILEDYIKTDIEENKAIQLRREDIPEMVQDLALSFIRSAKDLQLTPEQVLARLDKLPLPLPLAQVGAELYADYQRALIYRSAVDFDDLIRLALQALQTDPVYLERLQYRWPYILEDEAQDSSRLQQEILSLLSGPKGNWVRVGDPNQAIYETFTTANPRYLRQFIQSPGVRSAELPSSGRSTHSVIQLANFLAQWTSSSHPIPGVRDALAAAPEIQPVPQDDPQPNPPDQPEQIYLHARAFSPEAEINVVADSLARWLPDNPTRTVAVLTSRNVRANELVDALKARNIDFVDDLLRSTSATRQAAGTLETVLKALADPQNPRLLADVYTRITPKPEGGPQAEKRRKRNAERIRKCQTLENYLWPEPGGDWLDTLNLEESDPAAYQELDDFRRQIQTWQKAVLLPIDQLVLTLGQDLFSTPVDLALNHKLAVLLRQASQANPSWKLPELSAELDVIASNERRFIGFSSSDSGFNPDLYPGKVVVSTIHKAKGLEWDRVYLLSASQYDFPAGLPGEKFIAEKWFIRDQLNLSAETLEQLRIAFSSDENEWYQEGEASQSARLDYGRERLRLLYVGITRARRELVITWNTGRHKDQRPAVAFEALRGFWEQEFAGRGAQDEEDR